MNLLIKCKITSFLPQLYSLELDHAGEKEVQFHLADMEPAKN